MFQRAKQVEQPKNSRQRMWRYMTIDRLQELLESRRLYFRRVSEFDDGLEGRLTERSRERLRRWFNAHGSAPPVADEEVRIYQEHSKAFFANCWHMRDHESYLMWRAYADKGIAVQTNHERMQTAFESTTLAVTGGVVSYIDFERDQTGLGQVFTHVTTKDLPYADEREYRLLLWQHDPSNTPLSTAGKGVQTEVDPGMLIERVIKNPFRPELPRALTSRLEELGIAYDGSAIRHSE